MAEKCKTEAGDRGVNNSCTRSKPANEKLSG